MATAAQTPTATNSPASIPAGVVEPRPSPPLAKKERDAGSHTISPKQARAADDAYLEGAKHVQHNDLKAALHNFQTAVRLNPNDRDYLLAFIVTRENYVTELVQSAARARHAGDAAGADALLDQARAMDPDNREVTQQFETTGQTTEQAAAASGHTPKGPGLYYSSIDPSRFPAQDIASTLQGPIKLTPLSGMRDVHLHGDIRTVASALYRPYGIKVYFDPSVTGGRPIDLDMNQVGFEGAARVLDMAGDVFAVAIQPKSVLIAKDTKSNREALMPQVEETIYIPGQTNNEMQELANVARTVFGLQHVTASSTGGFILARGDYRLLQELNAVYDDMLNGNPEVFFDVTLYEIDKAVENNVGAVLPSSAGVFSIAAEAESLVNSNESIIQQAVASGLLTLNGSSVQNLLTEVEFLVASGTVSATQLTNLLGVFGGGLTYSGLFLGSNASFNLALTRSDVSILDEAKILAANHQEVTFRLGTRYPVVTGTYSTADTSSLASSLSGLNIGGTSVSSLLSQYLGSTSVTVPEFQYEDLGITLKMTPQVLRNNAVSVVVDLKNKALAGTSLDDIPILNNRSLTSTITVPAGQTAMLATLVSTSEMKDLTGLPGLNELPGFQGTDQDLSKDSTEVLITITPHIVRNGRLRVVSRRIDTVKMGENNETTGGSAGKIGGRM